MSVDQRLRTGLAANTQHLTPDVEHQLGLLADRVNRRRTKRRAVYAVAAVAVIVTGAYTLPDALSDLRGVGTIGPAVERPAPTPTVLEHLSEFAPLAPGTYMMGFRGAAPDLPRAVLEVTSPSFASDGNFLIAGSGSGLHAIGLWTVAGVSADPCYDNVAFPAPGPTVEDLAAALAAQPLADATEPQPVSLGGYDGLYIETSVPTSDQLSPQDCMNSSFQSWTANDGYIRSHEAPGEVDRLWILDVDGHRLVVGASHTPETTPSEIDTLTDMVESVTFATDQTPP